VSNISLDLAPITKADRWLRCSGEQLLSGWRFEPDEHWLGRARRAIGWVMAYALLLFVPLSLALRHIIDAPPGWIFLTSAAGIAVLADWIRRATEQLAARAGQYHRRAA
jgi:hypothetical protein